MSVLIALVIVALTLSVVGAPVAADDCTPHPVADNAPTPSPARARGPPAAGLPLDPAEWLTSCPNPLTDAFPLPTRKPTAGFTTECLNSATDTTIKNKEGATTFSDREFS